MATQSDATGLLNEAEAGDHRAADKLLGLVYDELHELTADKMSTVCWAASAAKRLRGCSGFRAGQWSGTGRWARRGCAVN